MTKGRIYTLDFYRIISAFFVFLFHSSIHLGLNYGILTPFIRQGAIFMTAFFILSGFSLYYNYHNSDLISLKNIKNFYLKRFISLYPLYLGLYILFLIFNNTLSIKDNFIIAPIEILSLQSFFNGSFPISHNGGTWFVSCLFFCYLLFPFFVNIFKQMSKKYQIITVIVCCFIGGISPMIANQMKFSDLYSSPYFRLLEFIIGIIIASIFLKKNKKNKLQKHNLAIILIEWAILILVISFLSIKNYGNYTLYGFFTIPLFAFNIYHLASLKNIFFNKILASYWMQYLSKISYAFFLSQFFTWKIILIFQKNILWFNTYTNFKLIITSFIISLIIAIALYELIDKPARKLFQHIFI